jgi:hypothetical protein
VLVEYLIPPKNIAITQGKHVFFEIDVKGGEKEWHGCYSWISKQPVKVSINAKGRDCWHVYRKSGVLVIDGKNRTWSRRKHKIRRRSEQYAEKQYVEIKAQKR